MKPKEPVQTLARYDAMIARQVGQSPPVSKASPTFGAAPVATAPVIPQVAVPQTSLPNQPFVQTHPGRRLALIIGNSAYGASVAVLPNPKRDAEAVTAALRGVGFQSVTMINDAGRDALVRALSDFAREADGADWALVYFAGHGIEVGGTNYLIPVDARLVSDRDVSVEAISLDQIMTYVEGAKRLRLVILDACRENPFLAKMLRKDPSRSIGRGLARYEPAPGSIVVFAAKEGQIALEFAKPALDGDVLPFEVTKLAAYRTHSLP
jgi:hypothetical protein